MTLTLPWPPSTNTSYATYNNRRIKSLKARQYTQHIQQTLNNHPTWHTQTKTITPQTQFQITLHLHPPDKRKRDINNHDKILIDAIFTTLNADDHQITQLNITKHPPKPPGQATIHINWHTPKEPNPCPKTQTGQDTKSAPSSKPTKKAEPT